MQPEPDQPSQPTTDAPALGCRDLTRARPCGDRIRRPLAALTVLFCAFTPLTAQDEPPADFAGKLDVTEVLLDVQVTDRGGQVIIGLGADDFKVEENGESVELTGVTFYSSRRLLAGGSDLERQGISIDTVPEDRYFIFFLEQQRAASLDVPRLLRRQLELGRDLKRWVADEMSPEDWAAVVSYDKKLKVHQDFTRDKPVLAAAVDLAVRGDDPSNEWPSRRPEDGVPGGPTLTADLPEGKELRRQTTTIYEGLGLLADAAGNVRGRKNLILFGTGFGELNQFLQYRPDGRYFDAMAERLNDNNVAVYGVDLSPDGAQHPLRDALSHISTETGGRLFYNFVSFTNPLREIAEANSGYYLLSYVSSHAQGESGFQEVDVGVANREFRVQARKGYLYGG